MSDLNLYAKFDFDRAKELLDKGYVVRNVDWPFANECIYYDSDEELVDEDGHIYSFEEEDLTGSFELFLEDEVIEEDECPGQETETTGGESGIQEHGEPNQGLKGKEKQEENENKILLQSKGKENTNKSMKDIEQIQISEKKEEIRTENIIETTGKENFNEERNGTQTTENSLEKNPENITTKTESETLPGKQSDCMPEGPMLPSVPQLDYSKEMKSLSMNLIDESANILMESLRGMRPEGKAARVVVPEITLTAVKTASEIRELMKLKLEVYKFVNDVTGK